MINSESYTVAAPTISLTATDDTSVDFVLEGEISYADPSSSVEVLDGSGDYEGEIVNESKQTMSLTVRAPAGVDLVPKNRVAGAIDGKTVLITSVTRTKGGNSPLKAALEATVTGDAV